MLKGAKYFTKFDVRWGYNNVRIRKGDKYKVAFKCTLGLYEPLVITFGLYNASATFQMWMNTIFEDLITEGRVIVYLDNILLFVKTREDLRKTILEVLKHLKENDLFLKLEKCSFNKTEIDYLGLIISENEVHMNPIKVTVIKKWQTPMKVKKVQEFLGFCNFYR